MCLQCPVGGFDPVALSMVVRVNEPTLKTDGRAIRIRPRVRETDLIFFGWSIKR